MRCVFSLWCVTCQLSSGTVLLPSDSSVFLTPWNWHVMDDGLAVTANPGAYLKAAWTGNAGPVVVMLNATTQTATFMKLAVSIDDHPYQLLDVPPEGGPLVMPSPADDVGSDSTANHSLVLLVQSSLQRLDRWGESPAHPPECALRLPMVRLRTICA